MFIKVSNRILYCCVGYLEVFVIANVGKVLLDMALWGKILSKYIHVSLRCLLLLHVGDKEASVWGLGLSN